jgi:hypothetical protein
VTTQDADAMRVAELVQQLATDRSCNPYPNKECGKCLCTIREGCDLRNTWEEMRKVARKIIALAAKEEA